VLTGEAGCLLEIDRAHAIQSAMNEKASLTVRGLMDSEVIEISSDDDLRSVVTHQDYTQVDSTDERSMRFLQAAEILALSSQLRDAHEMLEILRNRLAESDRQWSNAERHADRLLASLNDTQTLTV
jgi:hypothetical protein